MRRQYVQLFALILSIVIVVSSAPPIMAQIGPQAFICESYSGQLTGDTTWSSEECPAGYQITGNVLVPKGITLTIRPGTLIKFNANPILEIRGQLVARGTATQPISFTANTTNPAPGAWRGIVFLSETIDASFDSTGRYLGGSIIEYASIDYATVAISLTYASPYLKDLTIQQSKGSAVTGSLDSAMRLHRMTLQHNQGHGISLDSKWQYDLPPPLHVTITDSSITHQGGFAIWLDNSTSDNTGGTVTISGNTITQNFGGVNVKHYRGTFTVNLSGNTISANTTTGAYLEGSHIRAIGNQITGNTGYNRYPYNYYCVGGLQVGSSNWYKPVIEGEVLGNLISANASSGTTCSSNRNSYIGGLALNGKITVRGNTITNNTIGGGIHVFGGKPIINDNNIFGNSYGTSDPFEHNLDAGSRLADDPTIDARQNWWGTTNIAAIENGIFDYADNTGLNQALYAPFRSGPVYLISGSIKSAQDRPLAGVQISAGAQQQTTSDSSGFYVLSGLDPGSYTLTPSRANFSFSPTTRSVTLTNNDLSGQDFVGTQTSYSISGHILDAQGQALTDVTVSAGAGYTTATDATGRYELSGLANGSYTLVPTRRGYSFTPTSREVSVQGQDVEAQDFTGAIVYYTISGTIRNADGSPLSYARIDAGAGRTVYSDSTGAYSFTELQDNTYTIIPSYSGSTFEPAQRTVTVGPSASEVDFVRYDPSNQHTLSGTIVDRNGMALPGVTVANGKGLTVATNAQGEYRFERLPRGSYALTPQLSDYFFAPRNRTVNLNNSTSGINFVGGRADGASLLINYPNGRQGSYFTLVGMGYPANRQVQIVVNQRVLSTLTTDDNGSFSLILSTTRADPTTYNVRIVLVGGSQSSLASNAASASFVLDPNAPLRLREGSGSELSVPAGLRWAYRVLLPIVRR
ncbi:MAG: carboxypeptidase regulatory-like domain-containing protein [Oscillochloridaceae bacterium umkhey_bin13]